ncbi:MAG: hypothetical protein AABX05_00230 [Nanoarchaeota archaeon]
MKIIKVSVLLLLLTAAIVAGCKVADKVTENGPGAFIAGVPEASEKELSAGLQELDDIQALESLEVEINLTDVDSLQWD